MTAQLPTPEQLIDFVRRNQITFCAGHDKLEALLAAVRHCAKTLPPTALYLEAGVAMGGSALVIASAKPQAAPLRLYDVFEMLPPPTEKDGQKAASVFAAFQAGNISDPTGKRYFDHSSDLLTLVRDHFRAVGMAPEMLNVSFCKGLFEDTLKIDQPVALCHIDCDWYDSVNVCLERVVPHVLPGGVIVFDDYNSFEGCRQAVDEWLATKPPFTIFHQAWTLTVQRTA